MNHIQTILNETKLNGGCTMNPFTGEVPVDGYMVSSPGYERKVPRVRYSDIDKYAKEHKVALSSPNCILFLGTWKQSGITYMDLSIRFEDEESAMTFAAASGEKAIFDVANKLDIDVVAS